MQPQFISKPAFTVVGLLLRAKPMTPEIPKLWDQFVPRIDEIAHVAEAHVSYGLMGNFDHQRQEFDYMSGLSVTQVGDLPAGMSRWNVPANTYAVFAASLSTLGEVFGHIYSTWLPNSDYQHADAPYFERYGEDFNPDDNPVLSIYIPVEKKS